MLRSIISSCLLNVKSIVNEKNTNKISKNSKIQELVKTVQIITKKDKYVFRESILMQKCLENV